MRCWTLIVDPPAASSSRARAIRRSCSRCSCCRPRACARRLIDVRTVPGSRWIPCASGRACAHNGVRMAVGVFMAFRGLVINVMASDGFLLASTRDLHTPRSLAPSVVARVCYAQLTCCCCTPLRRRLGVGAFGHVHGEVDRVAGAACIRATTERAVRDDGACTLGHE